MNTIQLQRGDLALILEFVSKYPTVEFFTVDADSSSGIGTVLQVSVRTVVNGDMVKVTKQLVDMSSF